MTADTMVDRVTTASQRRQFLDLPEQLYCHDPYWVPRLRRSEQELAGLRTHAFQDQAETAAFLATRQGTVCGRIVAIDLNLPEHRGEDGSLGFIGFFESIDDSDVATSLFDEAARWLRQRGRQRIRGPISPSMNYEAGLLVEGFHSQPTFMMPHNLEYYGRLWESYGFESVQDLFAFHGHRQTLADMDEKVRKMSLAAEQRFNVVFRPLDRRKFRDDVVTFLKLYNRASEHTWGFVPLSKGEIQQLSGELKHLIIPELTTMATVQEKVVGAAFGMLDYNPIVKRIRGRLFPFGFFRMLTGRKGIKKARVMSANVVPEYQRWGLGLSLMGRLAVQGIQWGIEEVEFSYVLESNHLARATLEHGGATRAKTYRVFEAAIS